MEEGVDTARHVEFYFLLNADLEDVTFLARTFWIDDAKFDRQGINNYYILHHWTEKNPQCKRENFIERKFSVNVCVGVIKILFPGNLTEVSYEDVLRNMLFEMFEDVALADRGYITFQCGGCTAHLFWSVREWFDHQFRNC